MSQHTTTDVLIVGTGFSGLGTAIQLIKAGRKDFVVVEKAHDVGGTWRDNTYPGCACDIPSHMYSFSYEQNPNWTRSYTGQPEIWDYLLRVTDKYGLRDYIQFGVEMSSARWYEEGQQWHVTATSGDTYAARVLVSGIGGLHIPLIPNLPGLETFSGPAFHSAQWDHSVDLKGKRVAVVGTGASAIQFVPEIAPDVASMHVFQRTPPWVMPKQDFPVPGVARFALRNVPLAQRTVRNAVYALLEWRAIGFNGHPAVMKAGEVVARRFLKSQVKDPEIRAKLTPDYTMGCKRVLISNDYLSTYNRDNVHLITDGVAEVRENSVITSDGTEVEVDVILFGTGFHVTDAFEHLEIVGRDGRNLAKEFGENGMHTYLGINVSGFPNLFFLLGPNTALGHNSVVFMIEQQSKYVIDCLELLDRQEASSIDVKPAAQEKFQANIQAKLTNGVWTKGGCTSWYLDAAGVNRTIWPGFTWKYWLETRKVKQSDFDLTRSEPKVAA